MSKFNTLQFQQKAIEELVEKFKLLWENPDKQLPIVFKSPTGSGKTFMMAHFIQALNHQPNWDYDKAFIWITFSDDLAMQSKDKFFKYFGTNLENDLLTIADFNRGKLCKNDILFINWQKIVSRSSETRVLRRPEKEEERKEAGYYFEDVIEATKKEREIIFIVDESHTHLSDLANISVIKVIDPKILLKVSATPKKEDIPGRDEEDNNAGYFVSVKRQAVVEEGLIKEQILTQTEEELQREAGKDLDEIMLSLCIKKKKEIEDEYKKLGKKINPLVLIQLPNDDKILIEQGQKTKEETVLEYLNKLNVSENKIALWFDGKQKNLEFITDNNNSIDFMLFKQAAGTGWDCPRAHIIVMFREIQSPIFKIQTIGRILRMPEPELKNDYKNSLMLRTGYLITNYKRNEVNVGIPDVTGNKPSTKSSKLKGGLTNIQLKSQSISRIDYGDLADAAAFQKCFIESMCKFFEFETSALSAESRFKIEEKKIETSIKLTNQIIVDGKFKDFDKINLDLKNTGHDEAFELSQTDVEKLFNNFCYKLLVEQDDDETKITNIARSWSPLKSALRIWASKYLYENSDANYRVIIYDLQKDASSVFRVAIYQSLKEYFPIRKKIIDTKKIKKEVAEAPIFSIQQELYYTDDYEKIDVKLCAVSPFYILKEYKGRENELKFINYIDCKTDYIEWWFKNGASGKDSFSIKYFNTAEKQDKLFFPDWIIRFKNGKIGIFDTKCDFTAIHEEGRADGLSKRINELNEEVGEIKYFGGLVIFENGLWYFFDGNSIFASDKIPVEETKEYYSKIVIPYSYNKGSLSKNWHLMEKCIFS